MELLNYSISAEEMGAGGILSVAGYYNRPSQDGLYQHFKLTHDNINIPIIIYNISPRVVVDIFPETMAKLATLPRVVGLKDATANVSRPSLERQYIDKPFSYFSGEDITAVAYNAMGGRGCISVAASIAPKLCSDMQIACSEGDYRQTLILHEKLLPLHKI